MLTWLLSFINPLSRILKSIDNKVDNETERERIKSEVTKTYFQTQAQILTGPGWWIPILFVIPTAIHYGAIVFYSMLWCQGCAYPQSWSIAALPAPMDNWEGIIILSYFALAAYNKSRSK